jgi:hypothetical protein
MRHDLRNDARSNALPAANLLPALQFDVHALSLHGVYSDELSAHRAKRSWIRSLDQNFLLDRGSDYEMLMSSDLDQGRFCVKCNFTSACGRYAFWRLVNNQAPEVQYLLETAHVPTCDLDMGLVSAPDLQPMMTIPEKTTSITASLRQLFRRLLALEDISTKNGR